jgi:hypothetical protein
MRDLHAEAMQLEDDACNYSEIVQHLKMLSVVSLSLSRRLRDRKRPQLPIVQLPNRIVQLLVHADYAALISRDFSMRVQYLEEIASLHTRKDLLSQVKVGPKTVADIEEWLASKGRRLRRSDEDLSPLSAALRQSVMRLRMTSTLDQRERGIRPKPWTPDVESPQGRLSLLTRNAPRSALDSGEVTLLPGAVLTSRRAHPQSALVQQ